MCEESKKNARMKRKEERSRSVRMKEKAGRERSLGQPLVMLLLDL